MDHLWGEQGDGGELSGEGRSDGDEKDMEEEEEEEASEDEEEDDDDLELQAERPLKRGKHSLARLSVAMGAAGVDGGQGQDGSSAAIPSDDEEDGDDEGEDDEEEDDDDDDDDQEEEEKEVIEILDDDEEMEDHEEDTTAVSSHGRSNSSVSPAGAASKLEPIPLPSIFSLPANLLSRQSLSPRPATASSRDPASPSSRPNPRDRPRTWTGMSDLEHMLGVRSPSPPLAPHYAFEDRPTRSPGSSPPLDPSAGSPGTAERCGKMSPEELAAGDAGPVGIRSPVMPAQSEELEQALGMPATSESNGGAVPAWAETSSEMVSSGSPGSLAAGATGCASSGDGIGSSSPSEFPMELECAICFLPIAVMALFACGHGCCWECAHNWCSRVSHSRELLVRSCPVCLVGAAGRVCLPSSRRGFEEISRSHPCRWNCLRDVPSVDACRMCCPWLPCSSFSTIGTKIIPTGSRLLEARPIETRAPRPPGGTSGHSTLPGLFRRQPAHVPISRLTLRLKGGGHPRYPRQIAHCVSRRRMGLPGADDQVDSFPLLVVSCA